MRMELLLCITRSYIFFESSLKFTKNFLLSMHGGCVSFAKFDASIVCMEAFTIMQTLVSTRSYLYPYWLLLYVFCFLCVFYGSNARLHKCSLKLRAINAVLTNQGIVSSTWHQKTRSYVEFVVINLFFPSCRFCRYAFTSFLMFFLVCQEYLWFLRCVCLSLSVDFCLVFSDMRHLTALRFVQSKCFYALLTFACGEYGVFVDLSEAHSISLSLSFLPILHHSFEARIFLSSFFL